MDGSRRARLLDLVAGRSAAALSGWLADRTRQFRAQVEIVAMDGFGGYKNAATAAVPDAVTVMDPFYGDLRVMPRSGPLGVVAGPSAVRRSA